jgi:RNA recognition motif-containing protein
VIFSLTQKNEGGKMNKKVYVANLPSQTSEPELKVLFSKAGDVMSVKVQTGKLANREALRLWRCPHNGKPGELFPC